LFVASEDTNHTAYHTDKIDADAGDKGINSLISLCLSLVGGEVGVSTLEHNSSECKEEQAEEHYAGAV
jgi:hypothetical protein